MVLLILGFFSLTNKKYAKGAAVLAFCTFSVMEERLWAKLYAGQSLLCGVNRLL